MTKFRDDAKEELARAEKRYKVLEKELTNLLFLLEYQHFELTSNQ